MCTTLAFVKKRVASFSLSGLMDGALSRVIEDTNVCAIGVTLIDWVIGAVWAADAGFGMKRGMAGEKDAAVAADAVWRNDRRSLMEEEDDKCSA
jgi:hypothetical protein